MRLLTITVPCFYIAVDMLPIPGAQGITEAMFQNVFRDIFTGRYIAASMCIIRGISFYLCMAAGLVVWGIVYLRHGSR